MNYSDECEIMQRVCSRIAHELRDLLTGKDALLTRYIDDAKLHPLKSKRKIKGDVGIHSIYVNNNERMTRQEASRNLLTLFHRTGNLSNLGYQPCFYFDTRGDYIGELLNRVFGCHVEIHPLHGLLFDESESKFFTYSPFDLDARKVPLKDWLKQPLFSVQMNQYEQDIERNCEKIIYDGQFTINDAIRGLANKEGSHSEINRSRENQSYAKAYYASQGIQDALTPARPGLTYLHLFCLWVGSYVVQQTIFAYRNYNEIGRHFSSSQKSKNELKLATIERHCFPINSQCLSFIRPAFWSKDGYVNKFIIKYL